MDRGWTGELLKGRVGQKQSASFCMCIESFRPSSFTRTFCGTGETSDAEPSTAFYLLLRTRYK